MKELLTPKKLVIRTVSALVVLAVVMLICSLVGTESISLRALLSGAETPESVNPDYEIFVEVRLGRLIATISPARIKSAPLFDLDTLKEPDF